MHKFLRVIGVLFSIGLFSAVSLSLMADYSYPLIEKNREIVLKKSIYSVLPGTKSYKLIDPENKIYIGTNTNGKLVGYALFAEGNGYQGSIKIMVGINNDLEKITGIKILENVETPGLGAKISDPNFENQFKSKSILSDLVYVLNRKTDKKNEVEAITGATISTRAVVNIINKKINESKSLIEKLNG